MSFPDLFSAAPRAVAELCRIPSDDGQSSAGIGSTTTDIAAILRPFAAGTGHVNWYAERRAICLRGIPWGIRSQ